MSDDPLLPGECPICGRKMDLERNVCPHCNYDPEPMATVLLGEPRTYAHPPPERPLARLCASCGCQLKGFETYCPHCGRSAQTTGAALPITKPATGCTIAALVGFLLLLGVASSCALARPTYGDPDRVISGIGMIFVVIALIGIGVTVYSLARKGDDAR